MNTNKKEKVYIKESLLCLIIIICYTLLSGISVLANENNVFFSIQAVIPENQIDKKKHISI